MELERLQKIISSRGYCSRRKAEELILAGKVFVEGTKIDFLGAKFLPNVKIEICGQEIKDTEEKVAFAFNKPLGVVSTANDDQGRRTVVDFFKNLPYRLYPAGRLDYNTAGCLIVTNDGELAALITHPSSHLEKAYIATVEGYITDEELRTLHDGVMLEDGMTLPCKVLLGKRNQEVSIIKLIIHEGRNRQVRRMCEAVGHNVKSLYRESVGIINCNDIARGHYRQLTSQEITRIKELCRDNKANNVIPDIRNQK